VAHPLALLSDGFSQNRVCENLIPMIRHLSGSSLRSVVECHRHLSLTILGDKKLARVNYFKEKLLETKPAELAIVTEENDAFQIAQVSNFINLSLG
jgi:hypothetical protein